MLKKIKKIISNEKGSAMVLTAIVLTAIFGISALTVDMSLFKIKQKTLNNASDAAALAVTSEMVISGGSDPNDYKDLAAEVIRANGVPEVTAENIYFDRTGNKIRVLVKGQEETYFSKFFTDKDEQDLGAKSAVTYETQTIKFKKMKEFPVIPINASIDVGGTFKWNGSNGVANGGISVGEDFIDTCSFSTDGSVSCDGQFINNSGRDFTISGNLYSNGNTLINGNSKVMGDVESMGDVQTENTSYVYGKIKTNGKVTLKSRSNVLGDIEALGDVYIQEYPNITGDIKTNGIVTSNWADATINGTVYDNGGIPNDGRRNKIKTSSGGLTIIDSSIDHNRVSAIAHTPYVWRWDSLAEDLKRGAITLSDEAVSRYIDTYPSMAYTFAYYGGNLTFYVGANVQQFFDFILQDAGASSDTSIYIPGNLTFNNDSTEYTGCLLVENNITMNIPVTMNSNVGSCIASINGNITLGNGGNNDINGAIIVLNKNKKLTLNGSGKIKGAVISHGDLTMTMEWNINPDTDWQRYRKVVTEEDDGEYDSVMPKVRLINEDF